MTGAGRWLDEDELDTFRAFMQAAWGLPDFLNGALQRDSGLSFKEYYVLAVLAESPDQRLRMSRLAIRVNAERSRLTHMVKRLEGRGLVRREVGPADSQAVDAVLTEPGRALQAEAAPGHVDRVRQQFVDVLDTDELRVLRRCAEKIAAGLEAGTSPRG